MILAEMKELLLSLSEIVFGRYCDRTCAKANVCERFCSNGENCMKPIYELGKALINILIRCKFDGNTQSNITDITTVLYNMGVDELEARNISRKIDEIGDMLSASCKDILNNYHLSENRRDCIMDLLIDTYNKANIVADSF